MKQMRVQDVEAQLSEVVAAVANGEPTTITDDGVPVAMVVPMEEGRKLHPERAGGRSTEAPGKNLIKHLMAFPGGLDLELERDHTPPRDIAL